MRVCNWCTQQKPLAEYGNAKKYKDGVDTVCKRCRADYMVAYLEKNPSERERQRKRSHRRDTAYENGVRVRRAAKYGLTTEELASRESKFNGLCWACKQRPANCVDHQHGCPEHDSKYGCSKCVRGMLCIQCNTALGSLQDDPRQIEALLEYLNAFAGIVFNGQAR